MSVHSYQSAHNVLPVRTSREKCIRPDKSLFYSYIYLYKYTSRCIFNPVKGIRFLGTSLNVVRGFPLPVKREAGHQLDRVQHDLDPTDWKPMKSIGQGVREIRIQHEGQYRVIYAASFEEVVYVLHAFQKKSRKTNRRDLGAAKRALQEVLERRR